MKQIPRQTTELFECVRLFIVQATLWFLRPFLHPFISCSVSRYLDLDFYSDAVHMLAILGSACFDRYWEKGDMAFPTFLLLHNFLQKLAFRTRSITIHAISLLDLTSNKRSISPMKITTAYERKSEKDPIFSDY